MQYISDSMVCCGSQCCSINASHLFLIILGLFIAHVQASNNCHNISSTYEHCGLHTGVHDLDCFGDVPSKRTWKCEWKPGNITSKTTYTLVTVQENSKYCLTYPNLTGTSEKIKLFENENMTAVVIENPELKNCTKAIFRGLPKSLVRCGPPHKVTFVRRFGRLDVDVDWLRQHKSDITGYSVRYTEQGGLSWKNSSHADNRGTVASLNPHLVYVAQIKCDINDKCTQCPWSQTYTIPPELTVRPVLTSLNDVDNTVKGSRLVSLTWKIAAKERPDGYYVIIRKATGELPNERLKTTESEIKLNLSYSAYIVNISAFNDASTSPTLSQNIHMREDMRSMEAGRLNVTVHSNTSLTVYWSADLLKNYVCYCVEWSEKQHGKATYVSFFEDVQNHKALSLKDPLEPYKRYSLSLHTRPNKNTCNMKQISNGETTYGSTHFYCMEGSPISAPTNLSYHNVTSSSVVLQWSPIPEEDLRGFLLGYIIHCKEYNRGAHTEEKNLTIGPELTSCKLEDLKIGTGYHIQISAFTKAGAGVRSITSFFKTRNQAYLKNSVIITVFVVTGAILIIASPILKRTKIILWPSIPNPENSNVIRKLDMSCKAELMESLKTLKVEEWDTNSLQIIEEAVAHISLPFLRTTEEVADSPESASDWIQRDMGKDIICDTPEGTEERGLGSHTAFNGGYTTMEMFQQVLMSPSIPVTTVTIATEKELVVIKPGLDYVGQCCSSPPFDMSTRL